MKVLKWLFAIVVGLLLVLLLFSVGDSSYELDLYEVLRGKPVAILETIPYDDMPEEFKNSPECKYGCVQARYINIISGETNPKDGSYYLFTQTKSEYTDKNRSCGMLKTVSPIFEGWRPTLAQAQSNEKVFFQEIGLTGVGERGCETGTFLPDESYDPNLSPTPSNYVSIFQKAKCQISIWSHTDKTSGQCGVYGFEPTPNWIRVGVSGDYNTGMSVVYAFHAGMWVETMPSVLIRELVMQQDLLTKDNVLQFLDN